MDVLEEVEGRADSRAEDLGGWHECGSAWRGLGRCSCFASDLGDAELFGAHVMVTWELQKHPSALYTRIDSLLLGACAAKDLLPALREMLIRMCKHQ